MRKTAKVKGERANLVLLFALFAFFALNSFAQSFETLAEQINRGSTEQKRSALFLIRNLESAEASRAAIPALRDPEIIVRATAAFSVIFLPEDEAARVLLPLLNDKSELVRREAAYALGEVGSPSAVIPLLRVLQKDKILEVRGAAAVALGQIGDVSAIYALTQILLRKPRSEDEFIRRSAAKSIGQIADSLQNRRLNDCFPPIPDSQEPKSFQTCHSDLTEAIPIFLKARDILIRVLQNPREAQDVKREAAFALGEIGNSSAIPILQANFNNPDYYLAEISKKAVRKIQNKH